MSISLCVLCVLCGEGQWSSKSVPAVLTELRIPFVLRPAVSAEVSARRGGRCRLGQALREIALDLLAVAAAGVELLHQPGRARAQAARHLLPVGVGQLSHGPIEL